MNIVGSKQLFDTCVSLYRSQPRRVQTMLGDLSMNFHPWSWTLMNLQRPKWGSSPWGAMGDDCHFFFASFVKCAIKNSRHPWLLTSLEIFYHSESTKNCPKFDRSPKGLPDDGKSTTVEIGPFPKHTGNTQNSMSESEPMKMLCYVLTLAIHRIPSSSFLRPILQWEYDDLIKLCISWIALPKTNIAPEMVVGIFSKAILVLGRVLVFVPHQWLPYFIQQYPTKAGGLPEAARDPWPVPQVSEADRLYISILRPETRNVYQ